ncbi:hypothetical protein QQS21_010944 [Conoideocrella luteorostrata]|uniref:Acyltransferase 3 domain-containing protein n=1 Tax=Conoideocrella luteorostrata TaxID=1105319 RepID=A0AAJ0CGS1_9HYPO|nr:hypothetical protein QQS21_010944 [Conoideocrella luteorostrata]
MTSTSNCIISLRRHDLDNLRTFLTGLVIVHHTAIAYGAVGGHPVQSALAKLAFPQATIPLTLLVALNQSFFMGLFFWISGHVSAQSLERIDGDPARTRWHFIHSKCLRLGLPAILYTLVVHPFLSLISPHEWTLGAAASRLSHYFSTLRGVRGVVWYTANLLVLDVAAACWKTRPGLGAETNEKKGLSATKNIDKAPSWYTLLARHGWIATAGLSFVTRLYYPVGVTIKLTGLQPAYAPQYVLAYIIGHASIQEERRAKSCSSRCCGLGESSTPLARAISMSLLTVPAIWLPYLFRREAGQDWFVAAVRDSSGGWNATALLYAIWNEFSFITIGPALVSHFSRWHNRPATFTLFQPRYSYGAFLVHMVVIVTAEVALDSVLAYHSSVWKWLGPSALTVGVGAVNVCASFGLAKVLLDKFPFLRRII